MWSNDKKTVNDKLEEMWKDVAVIQLKVLQLDILGEDYLMLVGLQGENQSGYLQNKIQKHHNLSRLPRFKWETRK